MVVSSIFNASRDAFSDDFCSNWASQPLAPHHHTVVITGATGGIGFQSALGIAKTRSDARIIITGRNKERGEAAQKTIQMESGNDAIEFIVADVSSLKGVSGKRCTQRQ